MFCFRREKRDFDVIQENHKFVWEEDDEVFTWEQKLAKKYYDKLFKEYCICDLSLYKKSKVPDINILQFFQSICTLGTSRYNNLKIKG